MKRHGCWGSASIELAIMTPFVMAFFAAVVIGGRVSLARHAADAAAFDAARTASLARTPDAAYTAAHTAATNSFHSQGIACQRFDVIVDTSGFSRPVGQPATVRVWVYCNTELSDIAMGGMPGSIALRSYFISPLDTYRGRS